MELQDKVPPKQAGGGNYERPAYQGRHQHHLRAEGEKKDLPRALHPHPVQHPLDLTRGFNALTCLKTNLDSFARHFHLPKQPTEMGSDTEETEIKVENTVKMGLGLDVVAQHLFQQEHDWFSCTSSNVNTQNQFNNNNKQQMKVGRRPDLGLETWDRCLLQQL